MYLGDSNNWQLRNAIPINNMCLWESVACKRGGERGTGPGHPRQGDIQKV